MVSSKRSGLGTLTNKRQPETHHNVSGCLFPHSHPTKESPCLPTTPHLPMTKSAPPYPTSPPRPVMPTGIRWHTPSKTHSAKTAKTYGTTGQDKATTTRLVLPKPLGNPPSLKQAASPLLRCLSKLATTVTAPKSPTSPPTRSSAP